MNGIQFPEPIRQVPALPGAADAVAVGAIPFRVAVVVAGDMKQLTTEAGRITMVTLEGGAAIAILRLFDTSNGETTVDKRIGSVKAPINDYRGWSNSRGVRATKGVAVTLDQTDAEAWVYIIPGGA